MSYANVRPVKIGRDDPDLRVRSLKVVGYRAFADEEAVGPVRRTYLEARADAWQHNHPSGWVIPPQNLPPADGEATVQP